MRNIAFFFTKMSYNCISGVNGLDVLLSFLMFTDNIGVYFISDGVYQLLPNKNPEKVFKKNFFLGYKLLDFYNIKKIYICKEDLDKRGILCNDIFFIPVRIISAEKIRFHLFKYDAVLNF